MKISCLMLIGGLALAACSGGKPAETTQPALVEPTGTGPDTSTAAPTGAGVPCEQEIARVCGNGMVDGCQGNLTTTHVCVAANATAGPPCSQEVALQCPEGQTDACLMTPPAGATHVCVLR
jgi:hypothetical protein